MHSQKRIVWFLTLATGLAFVSIIGVTQNDGRAQKELGISEKANDAALQRAYGELAKAPWKAQQEKGEVASGVVVYEQPDTKLYLDSHPCSQKLYYFTRPYEKNATGKKVKCGNDTFDEFQVRQK